VFPVVSAILAGDYAMLSVLLAHGARLVYSPEDVSMAEEKRYVERQFKPNLEIFIASLIGRGHIFLG
jgi:hypothetical protein